MPRGKKGGPNPVWTKFVQGYKKANNCSLREAMQDCGGENGMFKKWQDEHEKVGGSIIDSINDFLWRHFAVPAFSSVKQALTNRWGGSNFDRFEGETFENI